MSLVVIPRSALGLLLLSWRGEIAYGTIVIDSFPGRPRQPAMPRPKITSTQPNFLVHPWPLSEETKEELINFLGYDAPFSNNQTAIARAIRRVEYHLGRYLAIAKLEKELPTNGGLAAELKRFIGRGDFRSAAFDDLHPWLKQKFRNRLVDRAVVEEDPVATRAAADDILQSLTENLRGRPRNRPLRDLVKQLRKVFRGFRSGELEDDEVYGANRPEDLLALIDEIIENREEHIVDIDVSVARYRSDGGHGREDRHRSGNAESLSEIENDELEFITFAIKATGIELPKNFDDMLRDIGRAPQDRADVLNRIARRAAKKRR